MEKGMVLVMPSFRLTLLLRTQKPWVRRDSVWSCFIKTHSYFPWIIAYFRNLIWRCFSKKSLKHRKTVYHKHGPCTLPWDNQCIFVRVFFCNLSCDCLKDFNGNSRRRGDIYPAAVQTKGFPCFNSIKAPKWQWIHQANDCCTQATLF